MTSASTQFVPSLPRPRRKVLSPRTVSPSAFLVRPNCSPLRDDLAVRQEGPSPHPRATWMSNQPRSFCTSHSAGRYRHSYTQELISSFDHPWSRYHCLKARLDPPPPTRVLPHLQLRLIALRAHPQIRHFFLHNIRSP